MPLANKAIQVSIAFPDESIKFNVIPNVADSLIFLTDPDPQSWISDPDPVD